MSDRPRLVVFSPNAEGLVEVFKQDGRFVTLPTGDALAGAVRVVGNLKPDVVLLDVGAGGAPEVGVVERIAWNAPFATVIAIGPDADPHLIVTLMQAGADGFLAKPMALDTLSQYVHAVHTKVSARKQHWADGKLEAVNPRRSHVVAVFSPKGGVGKTTVAVNLAVALRLASDRSVLLVDADLEGGDTAIMLGLRPKRTVLEYARALDAGAEVGLDTYLTAHSAYGIQLLAAPGSPEHSELIRGAHMRQALDSARPAADFVVVDTAPTFSEPVLAVLDSADTILLLVTPDITALKNVRLSLDVMATLRYPAEKILVVMNRTDHDLGLTPDQVSEVLGRPVQALVPNNPQVVMAAVNQGKSFMVSHPDAPVAKALNALARHFADAAHGSAPAAAPRRTFWQRLLRWG